MEASCIYYVRVCSFTFSFRSVEHVQEYLDYFSQKVHASASDALPNAPHWERQTHFDQLPLYLFEEPKRQKVIKAFERAIKEFSP